MFVSLSSRTPPPLLCCICSKCPTRRLGWRPRLCPVGVVGCSGNLRVLSGEEKSSRQKKKKKNSSPNISSPHISIHLKKKKNPPCYPLLSPSHAKRNSHILTLSIHLYTIIYLHSYLKYFFYKCVYKLKIISLCLVTKWHLQGRGCVGLRFVIALQEPTKRQHQTLSK